MVKALKKCGVNGINLLSQLFFKKNTYAKLHQELCYSVFRVNFTGESAKGIFEWFQLLRMCGSAAKYSHFKKNLRSNFKILPHWAILVSIQVVPLTKNWKLGDENFFGTLCVIPYSDSFKRDEMGLNARIWTFE